MDPEKLQTNLAGAQLSQPRLTADAAPILEKIRRDQKNLTATLFWRDVREVGTSLLLFPVWLFMGITLRLPWTWYLTVPALMWIAGYLLVDRMRHKRRPPELDESLRHCVECSLAEVEHQIKLLRGVLWWYLMPIAIAMMAFFVHVAWEGRAGGWWMAIALAMVVAIGTSVLGFAYWLNQYAVRSNLVPQREELQMLLSSLKDESPGANSVDDSK